MFQINLKRASGGLAGFVVVSDILFTKQSISRQLPTKSFNKVSQFALHWREA
jgi:hypothetical protein